MRIVVMGTGGVGGYFGARLAAAGEDVRFVARGAHLEAMRRDGLKIESKLGDLTLKPVKASHDPKDLGPADLVMIAVKLWGTQDAIEAVRPLVGPKTSVVSFQNGVGAIDALTKVFGAAPVLGGVAHIAAVIGAPGVIKHTGTMAKLTIGEPRLQSMGGGTSPRVQAFYDAAKKAGIDIVASEDIEKAIWDKFVFLASFSGVTALTRQAKGPIMADPDMRRLFADAIAEACAVARAKGIKLAPDHEAKALGWADGLPAEMKASMLHDLEAGNRLEVEFLSGAVARLGAAAGVPTPVHRAIYAALKPYAAGRAD
jgi:2-dehydropantoate 2-reductase